MQVISLLAMLAATQGRAAAAPGGSASGRVTVPGSEAVATATRSTAPRIDGRLDDSSWSRATAIGSFRQRDPDEGAPGTERTEVRVLYDDEALFVGVRAFDARPDLIAAPLARRDEAPPSDWIGILIDSYHDRRTAFEFVVNPAGVKQDIYHFNDAEVDSTWNAVWDVGVSRDSSGWSAEFRIPWSQLRFGQGNDRRFGFNVWRRINRTNELQHWRLMAKNGQGDASRYGELVGFTDLHPRRKLEVSPYTLLGRSYEPAEPGNPFKTGKSGRATMGADLRYGLTSNLTLSAAINPDFGQVEADPAVVNLTATETFYPEKRPFFTEGSDVFRFRVSPLPWSSEQFFYSRRIGRAVQLTPDTRGGYASTVGEATILGAAKVQGKTPSGWTIGALTALTTEETATVEDAAGARFREVVEPRTGYGVARLAKDFRNGRTVLGAFSTLVRRDLPASVGSLRSDALAAGLELNHRFGGDRYALRATAIGSRVSGSAEAIASTATSAVHYFQRPDITYASLEPGRTSLTGYAGFVELKKDAGDWLFGAQAATRSPGLELNDAGYQTDSGRNDWLSWVAHQWTRPGKLFRSAMLRSNQWYQLDYDGRSNDRGIEVFGNVVWKNYTTINFWTGTQFGAFDRQALRGGPSLAFPAGAWIGSRIGSDQRKALRLSLQLDHWRQLAGTSEGNIAMATVAWRPSSRLDLSVGPRYTHEVNSRQFVASGPLDGVVEYVVGDLSQKTVSLATRGNFTFSPTLSVQLYAEPFVSSGRYLDFKRVADAHAAREGRRFEFLDATRLVHDGDGISADLNGDGTGDLALGHPDFSVLSLRSTAVVRWEYRPASTIFLVWQQARGRSTTDGRFRLGENLGELFGAQASNTLLLKVSHWLSVR